eukprot:scaffold125339_cov66-Phaeocystis_antarctica.AAC.4
MRSRSPSKYWARLSMCAPLAGATAVRSGDDKLPDKWSSVRTESTEACRCTTRGVPSGIGASTPSGLDQVSREVAKTGGPRSA